MKSVKTIKALEKELKQVKSGVAGDTIFSAKAVFFIAQQQVEIVSLLKKLTKTSSRVRAKRWYEFWK